MALVRWDPMRELEDMQTRLNRLFGIGPARAGEREDAFLGDWSPRVDIQESDQGYTVKADLPDIAYEQELEVDELFPVAEAMQLLRLADVEGGDIKLTHMGKRFAEGEMNERKEIFSRALMNHVPLASGLQSLNRHLWYALSRRLARVPAKVFPTLMQRLQDSGIVFEIGRAHV